MNADSNDWGRVRGFNYHPGYAANLIEIWDRFDARAIEAELKRGKAHFPGINVLRWWHSWDAFSRDPEGYVEKFRVALSLSEGVGCKTMPVLFNRTHMPPMDFGGIYIDHFLPGSALYQPGMFDRYLEMVVGGLGDDPRIVAWDLCNEPFWYHFRASAEGQADHEIVPPAVVEAERRWLKFLYERCKTLGARAPLTVSSLNTTHVPLSHLNDVSDLLTLHAYYAPAFNHLDKATFERQLDEDVAYARSVGKPLLVSECCWGALDDEARARDSRYELEQISRRGIGFLAYVMHHSRMPDSHGLDGGPVGAPADLSFTSANGALRPGHEFFNEF